MSEPNHLSKANHLRFSFALIFIVVAGLCIIGFQKFLQWKADSKADEQQKEYATRPARNLTPPEPAQEEDVKTNSVIHQRLAATVVKRPAKTNATQEVAPPAPISLEPENASNQPAATPPLPSVGAFGLPPQNAKDATIYGTVVLNGTPPPEKVIEPLVNDPMCGKFWTNKPTTRFYVTGGNGELANVFVYIKEGVPAKTYLPPGPVELNQIRCNYEPYIIGMMVNQRLQIKNSDPLLHNVHASPINNPEFNFAQPIQGQMTSKAFSTPELMIRIKCDVHPWMFAYVGVVDHPYFAVTDATGSFEFNGLSDGVYTLEAIHLKAGRLTKEVVLKNGKIDEPVLLSLSVPQ